jgi:hypothetical protein
MANVDHLICSFCQGPSSRLLRERLEPHLSNPHCRIRPSDLDWLDKWRLLLPSHVEWDLDHIQDVDLQNEYEKELPKENVVSHVKWVPSSEGRISATSDDLDAWRTVEFISRLAGSASEGPTEDAKSSQLRGTFEHLLSDSSVRPNIISKRTLHPYNDDIGATRLPFHSACLRILYEGCNEVTYNCCATSTVSDVVATTLLPAWREGNVSMNWLSRRIGDHMTHQSTTPWGDRWHPLDPSTNVSLLVCSNNSF